MSVNHHKKWIEVSHLSFAYGSHTVFTDVCFEVHPGDYLGMVGPNGGGKTTLVRLLLGLLKPTSGEVELTIEKSSIAYVSQKPITDAAFPATVREVVVMGRAAGRGIGRHYIEEDYRAVDVALTRVGMDDLADRLIGDLSGGQQQRVRIARALVSDPELLILDEPTTGVDSESREQLYLLLKKLNTEEGLTLLLVTHDREAIEREATELVVVDKSVEYIRKY